MNSLHPDIVRRIEEQEKNGGVDVSKLEAGTNLIVTTHNSVYNMCVIKTGKRIVFEIRNTSSISARYFAIPEEVVLNGSTWGGSTLKLDWIGKDMHMELVPLKNKSKLITTSGVKSVKIIAPDKSWDYELWGYS